MYSLFTDYLSHMPSPQEPKWYSRVLLGLWIAYLVSHLSLQCCAAMATASLYVPSDEIESRRS
jgi:hypothetical protein